MKVKVKIEIDIDGSLGSIQNMAIVYLGRRLSVKEVGAVVKELTQIAENEANSADAVTDVFEDLFGVK